MFDPFPLEKNTIIEREVSLEGSSNELSFKTARAGQASEAKQKQSLRYSQFSILLANLNQLHLKSAGSIKLVQNQYLMVHFGEKNVAKEQRGAQKKRLIVSDTQKALALVSNCRSNQSLMAELKRLKPTHAEYQIKTLLMKEDIEDFMLRQKVSSERQLPMEQLQSDIEKDAIFVEALRMRNNFMFVFPVRVAEERGGEVGINVVLYTSVFSRTISTKLLEQQIGEVEYRVEIEFEQRSPMTQAQLTKVENEFGVVLRKVLMNFQQSPQLVTATELHSVQKALLDVFSDDTIAMDHMSKYQKIYVPPVSTISQENIRDIKRYSVTDKADGQRQQLIFQNQNAYLVQPGGQLTKLQKVELKTNAIFDCEVVNNNNSLVVLCFDVVYSSEFSDLRDQLLEDRIDYIVKFYNALNKPAQSLSSYKDLRKEIQDKQVSKIEEIRQLNESFVQKHFANIKSTLASQHAQPVKPGQIRWAFIPKVFLFPCGIDDSETIVNIDIIRKYHAEEQRHHEQKGQKQQSAVSLAYETDGEILTPDVPFSQLFKTQHAPLKIKPVGFNTIDVLVQFQYNNDLQFQTYTINQEHFVLTKIYCKRSGLKVFDEIPKVLIKLRQRPDMWEPHDIDGNPIDNGSVVEFVFIKDQQDLERGDARMVQKIRKYSKEIFGINDQFIIPMRTRFDKSDKQMPNAYNTIMSVIQTTDIYRNISDIAMKDAKRYYKIDEQKRALTEGLRQYHNFVKWLMIQISCLVVGGSKKTLNVMDVGSGQGGDLRKYSDYVERLFLVEPSQADLDESAKRAKNMKMDLSRIIFINVPAQDPIKVPAGVKIDFFNCQMMIHYLF